MIPHVKDLMACIGLMSLLFLRQWGELQGSYTDSTSYFLAAPPSATAFIATLLIVLISAGLLWGASIAARLARSRWPVRLGRSAFLLLLGIAMPPAAVSALFPYGNALTHAAWILGVLWMVFFVFCATLAWAGSTRPFLVGRHLAVVFSPLLLLVIVNTVIGHRTACRTIAAGGFALEATPRPAAHRDAPRVLVIIFDELDAEGYVKRPENVQMPALKRLREEALWCDQVQPPARCTLMSVPMMFTGLAELAPDGSEPVVRAGLQKLPAMWGKRRNLFDLARAAGATTALIGWYHPYCSALGASIDYCWSSPSIDVTPTQLVQEYCRDVGIAQCTVHQVQRRVRDLIPGCSLANCSEPLRREHQLLRRQNLGAYLEARERLLRVLRDDTYGLIVAHLPIPHPLGIYDRKTDRLTLDDRSNYFDNLELTDRTLAEVRAVMEDKGLWDVSSVIITSDHGFRPSIWNYRPTWTAEEASISGDRESLRVPLVVKLARAAGPSRFADPLNALIVHDLSLELLRGGIRDYEQLHTWLGRNRKRTQVPHLPRCF